MNSEVLKEIGLTDSESKVYLALLELGDSTRIDLVKKSKIAGSKIYEVLEKLQEKGLASVYLKNKIKHFKPTNPNQILSFLESKKEKIINIEKKAKLILPQLLLSYNSSIEDEEVEVLSGIKGLEVIFREQIDTLKKDDICYVISGTWGTGEEQESLVQTFFEKIHLMRENKKIKTKMLFNLKQKDTTEKLYSSKRFPLTTTRYIEHASPVAINLYKDRTVVIIFGKKISSICISSQDVSNSFLEYFNMLWGQAKK